MTNQQKELSDKIAKMEAGLDNPNISDSQKQIMRKAIETAKKELEKLIVGATKKQIYIIQNEKDEYYNRSIPSGKSSWTDNWEMAYTFDDGEIKSMVNFVAREYPNMKVKEILLEDAKRMVKKEKPKTTNDPTFTTYKGQEIMFVPVEGKYYVNDVEYFSMEEAKNAIDGKNQKKEPKISHTATFFETILTNENELSKTAQELKKMLMDKEMFVGDTLNEENMFVALRAEKIMKMFCSKFDLESAIVKDFLRLNFEKHFDKKTAEKLELKLADLVVSNFVSNSQYMAMRSKELDTVKRNIYARIMETPIVGSGHSKYFLHYFTPGSDFYISEIDLGTNQQDFGFAILNGDLQMAERGYISIEELITSKKPAELDLYFDPISHKELMEELEERETVEKKHKSYLDDETIDSIMTDFISMKHDDVMPEYRRLEGINEHTLNVVLMACKVGDANQRNLAKELYLEQQEKGFVDASLKEKIDKLYYEMHDEFRDKYLKVDEPTISVEKIEKLVNKTIAQVFLEYGNNTEIVSINEIVSDDQIDVHFELIREIDGMKDRREKAEVHISFDGDILDEFTFKIPDDFNVDKFLSTLLDEMDMRTRNAIYSYNIFLMEHAEELIGEKVATKTVKKLPTEKQEILKREYAKKAKQKAVSKSPEAKVGKVKLTKRLKAHGVTQEMVDEVNKTGKGVTIKSGKQAGGKSSAADKRIKYSLVPGKRLSVNGKVYYEYRKNRSDKNPDKGL